VGRKYQIVGRLYARLMPTPTRGELREWSAALTLGPLDVSDPAEKRYVELADAGRGAVDDLHATIELSIDTTTHDPPLHRPRTLCPLPLPVDA
jgi:hypothetical protein